jgi:O-6-methylguanine DNA methyltransferase
MDHHEFIISPLKSPLGLGFLTWSPWEGALFRLDFSPPTKEVAQSNYPELQLLESWLQDTPAELLPQEFSLQPRIGFCLQRGKTPGTFTQKIWHCMASIPYGTCITYRDLAIRAGSPKAFRAAGSACGFNPLPLFIPCHRVIPSQGGYGNFSLGPHQKRYLLEKEGIDWLVPQKS